jgi:signal transduction histidine kinase/CheY-like chemotaxis protein/HPt (histidine-containing phosphotransfer) domain-containing protein
MVRYVSQDMFFSQKSEHLMSLARVLDQRLGADGYDGILKEAGAESATREEKIAVLNRALHDATEETASVSGGLGVGFYSIELDAALTYGPSARFGNIVGVSIAPEHPGRRVMATNTPMTRMGTMVRGDIMNAMIPVVRHDKVIGYIWANELLSDIEITLNNSSKLIFFLLASAYGLMTLIIVAFLKRLTRAEKKSLAATRSAAEETKRLGGLMYIVNQAVVSLLAADEKTFEEALQKCMRMMASAFEIDRIVIWENDDKDGRPEFKAVADWLGDVGQKFELIDFGNENFELEALAGRRDRLARKETLTILHSRLSNKDRLQIAPTGIRSLTSIPVFLEEKFWGFVSFASCLQERKFTRDEEDILLSGSLLMANAIVRRKTLQSLMQAHEQALAASQAKSAFLATVSHELRTPLNAIIGLSEVELREDLSENTRGNLEKILNSGSNLLAIVNDILDISKIEAGNFEIIQKDFDISSLLNDVVQLNIVRIGSKNISFALKIKEDVPSGFRGDELRIKQVLNNLLSNAFKYTERGRVVLHVRCRDEGDEAVLRCTVTDTGVGIRKEEIEKLFKEYSQMKSRPDHSVEGTGLGLSIAKYLVELMGGTIRAKSLYGKGSTFMVTFRLKIVDKTPIGRETADNLRKCRFIKNRVRGRRNLVRVYMPQGRVLVVDDVRTNLAVARGLMMPYGLTIDSALSGREAIDIIRAVSDNASASGRYDIIFMDHMMPEMDGMEATRIIRNEIGTEYARTVPIVALTANALSGSREMFLRNGFDGFISKPIDIYELDAALKQWVNKKEGAEATDGNGRGSAERAEATDGKGVVERAVERVEAPPADSPGIPDDARVDGIDFKAGTARYENEDAYLKIIRSYVRHTPELLEKLSVLKMENPGKEEMREYAAVVHGLKGSSFAVCADAVGKRAEALEHAARAEEWGIVLSGHADLIKATHTLIARLEEFLKSASERAAGERKEKPLRAAPDRAILEKMLSAARRFKTWEMDDLLAELDKFDYENEAELVGRLEELISDMDYDAVTERLEKILRREEPTP